ncbi:hypothetical protein C0216_08035 [Streptomyces globosus]|uniref:Uncharacterized protein n=1 Tax=Streptomyces globosus TaxID=68209 RepID=A0A344TXQ1_9ACTN|nr:MULTISPECIES: hypothetical protein [Streptomyces]AXE23422.1 hypothetical protein C0216_08035 [Streptomyces globosus]
MRGLTETRESAVPPGPAEHRSTTGAAPARRARATARHVRRALVAFTLALLLSACYAHVEVEPGGADPLVGGGSGENTPAEVFNMPDGFGNLATKCVGVGKRAYVTTRWVRHDDPPVIVPADTVVVDDPTCQAP